MTHEEIARINYLAKKQKTEGLTPAEKAEQATLRQSYLTAFRQNMESVLQSTYIQHPDGTKTPLKKKG